MTVDGERMVEVDISASHLTVAHGSCWACVGFIAGSGGDGPNRPVKVRGMNRQSL